MGASCLLISLREPVLEDIENEINSWQEGIDNKFFDNLMSLSEELGTPKSLFPRGPNIHVIHGGLGLPRYFIDPDKKAVGFFCYSCKKHVAGMPRVEREQGLEEYCPNCDELLLSYVLN